MVEAEINSEKKDHANDDRKTKPVVRPEISVPERYDSPFMKLIAPFIATRYFWLAIEEINPFDFLKKRDSLIKDGAISAHSVGKPWKEPSMGRYFSRNFAAFGMGLTFLAAMGFYSRNTFKDIKSLYSEAVAYEFDKKPEDVTLWDIFSKSENAALKVTRGAYLRRTAARLATAGSFFFPWQIFRGYKELKPEYGANANAGVGAVGAYLLAEGYLRDKSFFDALQEMVSSDLHHNNANPNQSITSMRIKGLLALQRKHLNKDYQWPNADSPEGKSQLLLAERIASLMNQTYGNDERVEEANFTIGKFIYLAGFGLLDKFPESLAFVELANKSADMKEVKQAALQIKTGHQPQQVFAEFGIDMNELANVDNKIVRGNDKADNFYTDKHKPHTHQDYAKRHNPENVMAV